jgi:membrane protease YdiL (CAAX protease family)
MLLKGESIWRAPLTVLPRVAVFAVLAYLALWILSSILYPLFGLLIASVLGAFGAAAIANALVLRIYEQGRLPDIGLSWTPASSRHLGIGLVVGAGAALVVLGAPLAAGLAEWRPATDSASGLPSFLFVTLVLLFGAVGEEMLFRGYGFQIMAGRLGPAATILPMAVLFAFAHATNEGIGMLGLFNTFSWGVVLGWSVLRSGDLWLPIGLHFGWNWMMPLLGVNLSGFTMRVTGVALHWNISDLWSGGSYGPEGGLLTTLVLVPVMGALIKAPVQPQQLALARDREEAA